MSTKHKTGVTGRLGYLLDERYLRHNPGPRHPESPQRLAAIQEKLRAAKVPERWTQIAPREAALDDLALIHTPDHIARIDHASRRAPAYLDMDTGVSMESYSTALLAAGGSLACIDALCAGSLRRIFACVRPPGHHANSQRARGFCLFNNVAVAAAYARHKYGLKRIAIIDFDVHHGNGTQSCFYDSPEVLYVSTHQFPFYPGTGDFDECGTGDGAGYTLNFPLPAGASDADFVPIFSKIVSAVLDQFQPQLILVSAGFDGHYDDPLGGLNLTGAAFASTAASLILAAERWSGGRICFILEGGYSMKGLQECSQAVIQEFEKRRPDEASSPESALFREISVRAAKYSRWKW